MAQTDRLGLPLLAAGQAQKELTHNEALTLIDMSVQLTVESADLAAPPTAPEAGQCWIVAPGASGAWLDRAGAVAGWSAGGWLFASPREGWRAWAIDRGNDLQFDGADWVNGAARADGYYVNGLRVAGERQAAISGPTGGAIQDVEARATLEAILDALRAHGLVAA